MHELSIANHLVEIATQHAHDAGAVKVEAITLRIGALSCVHKDALEFSFDLVTEDTLLAGAKLKIIDVPVAIYCAECDKEVELPGIQSFRCTFCDTPSAVIRKGKELDIESIEITESNATPAIEPQRLSQ